MRKKPTSRSRAAVRPRPSGPATDAAASAAAPPSTNARPASPDELAAIARAQQGQPNAESFWKAAGRFTKLR